MSLLRAILAAKPVRTPLDFGINDNVRLISIDNNERTKDGEKISRNIFMTFAKYNAEGKRIAASEFSYYNLDHTSKHVRENFIQQVFQLNDICKFLGIKTAVDPTTGMTMEELDAKLGTKAGCQELIATMWEQFSDLASGLVGETSPLGRLKVVTDTKGKWLQLGRETHIIEPMSVPNTLTLSAYDLKLQQAGLTATPETADGKGTAPDKTASSLANL